MDYTTLAKAAKEIPIIIIQNQIQQMIVILPVYFYHERATKILFHSS
jgi:hypothetical protein